MFISSLMSYMIGILVTLNCYWKNLYRNLNPGGQILSQDAHINAAKNGPLPVAEYSVLLMFASEGKCYSISEMEYVPTVANWSVIIGEK